jgi:hypothetical protein
LRSVSGQTRFVPSSALAKFIASFWLGRRKH